MGTPLVNIGLKIGLVNIEKNSQLLYRKITHIFTMLHQISVIYVQRSLFNSIVSMK